MPHLLVEDDLRCVEIVRMRSRQLKGFASYPLSGLTTSAASSNYSSCAWQKLRFSPYMWSRCSGSERLLWVFFRFFIRMRLDSLSRVTHPEYNLVNFWSRPRTCSWYTRTHPCHLLNYFWRIRHSYSGYRRPWSEASQVPLSHWNYDSKVLWVYFPDSADRRLW